MKLGVVVALLAGLCAAIYLIWWIGFSAIAASVAQAGLGGLALLCLYQLAVYVVLTGAWTFLLPPGRWPGYRDFYLARLVRDSIAEISPFSPVGGMLAAVRLMILKGMGAAHAAASTAADATTEAMAQVVFLAFGLALGFAQFRHMQGSTALTQAMILVLLLAVPGIALLIFLQRKGAHFAEKMAGRFFPAMREGVSFHAAIEELYAAPGRLAVSSALHLLAWVGAGGGTWLAFRLVGGDIALWNALALEALLCTIRSIFVFMPAAIGVQEASYAMLGPLFGLPAEMGVAVSLLKRAREIVMGVPALLWWQSVEGRTALKDRAHG